MHESETQHLSTSILTVDHDVQRPLDRGKVARIAAEYNPAALGVITVSYRASGEHAVIDGQHRVAALESLGGTTVGCRVFRGLTRAAEAELFRLLNNTNRPQPLDLFRVRVVEGDAEAVGVNRILTRYGWTVRPGRTQGAFGAVSAAQRVYRTSPVALDLSIGTLTAAWGPDSPTVDGRLVEGLGMVYARYGNAIVVEGMVERLAKFPGGSGALIGKARGLTELSGGRVPAAVAEIVVTRYNARRKSKAIPDWRG